MVTGKVVEKVPTRGGRIKVKITATLQDGGTPERRPGDQESTGASSTVAAPIVYAEMTGISIEGVRLPSRVPHDAIDDRTWETAMCTAADGISAVGDARYQDTGWNL